MFVEMTFELSRVASHDNTTSPCTCPCPSWGWAQGVSFHISTTCFGLPATSYVRTCNMLHATHSVASLPACCLTSHINMSFQSPALSLSFSVCPLYACPAARCHCQRKSVLILILLMRSEADSTRLASTLHAIGPAGHATGLQLQQ